MNRYSDKTPMGDAMDLRDFIRNTLAAFNRRRKIVGASAGIAAAAVLFSAVSTPPGFTSAVVVTSLFDNNDDGIGPDVFGALSSLQSATQILRPKSRGRLFPVVLNSRSLTEHVMATRYTYEMDGVQRTEDLFDYIGVRNPDAAAAIVRSRICQFHMDPATGATTIRITTRSPELSRQVAQAYVSCLTDKLNSLRQAKIRGALRAVDHRLQSARDALLFAETEVASFREQNRNFDEMDDPELVIRSVRLDRNHRIAETMVSTLETQRARLTAKVRDDQDRVTVVSPPSTPIDYTVPDVPKAVRLAALLAFVAAAIASVLLAAAEKRDVSRRARHWRTLVAHSPVFGAGILGRFRRRRVAEGS